MLNTDTDMYFAPLSTEFAANKILNWSGLMFQPPTPVPEMVKGGVEDMCSKNALESQVMGFTGMRTSGD